MANVGIQVKIPPGLSTADAVLSDEVISAVQNASMAVEREAKSRVPVKTGTLRRSIMSTVSPLGGKPTGIVSAPVKYAPAVEYGTGVYSEAPGATKQPIVIRPKTAGGLFWPGAPHPMKKVTVQGMKPRPYMRPAFAAKKQAAIEKIQQAIQAAIERMKG
jgi:HK97 gp10 family phage protein